ncbi:MAG TPA: response regulator transcription factor [Candidatus Limnocylindria bacterium]|nr:response regulator transcription factor [Candidatus Limnocylindria bacterium]
MKAATASKAKRAAAPAPAATGTSIADKKKFRIILVEDHPIVRQGLAQLINQQPGLSVVGEAESAAKALELVRAQKPDLVILDVSLPKTNGLELIKQLKSEKPQLPMLVISMHDETLYAERALRAGARGYVMKKEPSEKMLLAINRVLKGEIYVSDRMKQKMLQHLVSNQVPEENSSPLDHLSDRELEVFQLLGNGFATRQIAEQLNLSIKTIESYRENLKLKLSVKSGAELIQHAIQWMKSEPVL